MSPLILRSYSHHTSSQRTAEISHFEKLIQKEKNELDRLEGVTGGSPRKRLQSRKRDFSDLEGGNELCADFLGESSSESDESESDDPRSILNDESSSDEQRSSFSQNEHNSNEADLASVQSARAKPEVIVINSDADSDMSVKSSQHEHDRSGSYEKMGTESDDDISFNDEAVPALDLNSDSEDEHVLSTSSDRNTNAHVGGGVDDVRFDEALETSINPDTCHGDSEDEDDYEDGGVLEEIQNYHEESIAQNRLSMEMQGFRRPSVSQHSQSLRSDHISRNEGPTVFDPPTINYHGTAYHINRCYKVKLPSTGVVVTVGILRFIDETTARCILVSNFGATFLGIGGEGHEVDRTMQKIPVQVHKHVQDLSLSNFQNHPSDGEELPQLIYEPR